MFLSSRSHNASRTRVVTILFSGLVFLVCFPSIAPAQWVDTERHTTEVSDRGVLKFDVSQNSWEKILEYREIETSVEAVRDYLNSLQPDHPFQKKLAEIAREHIANLGSESYRVRRKAREQLGKMTTLPLEELKAARASRDPEVRASAAMLLEYSKKRAPRDSRDGITRAVCEAIIREELKGLVNELLETLTLFDDDETTSRWLRDAIVVSALETDVDTLESLVGREERAMRITGVRGLVQVQREDSTELLSGLTKDDDEHVRVVAARELANMGRRNAMESLIGLMKSEELEIRMTANRVLRALTDQNFQFYAFEKIEKRKEAVKRWDEWLANAGAEAELHFPLVEKEVVLGRILLSDYSAGKIVELDMEGNTVWEKNVPSPWAVEGLPNGHRLIGLYSESSIVEFDAEGNEVRRIGGIPGNVMGFCRLDNGNILATGSSANKVLEYDLEGNVVWEKEVGGRPTDIKMLENGNMIIALMDQSRIVEINREGERVLEIETEASPLQVQPTDRGTFITAHSSQQFALEYNRDGEIVRRIEIEKSVTGAREMANGDMILATSDTIRRQRPDGTVVWEFKDLTYCYNISPY